MEENNSIADAVSDLHWEFVGLCTEQDLYDLGSMLVAAEEILGKAGFEVCPQRNVLSGLLVAAATAQRNVFDATFAFEDIVENIVGDDVDGGVAMLAKAQQLAVNESSAKDRN